MMNHVRIAGRIAHSSANGPGVRYVLFFQGCPHHCKGCHNPDTHDENGGTETTVDSIIEELRTTRYLDGITFSGGDPLIQPEALAMLAQAAKEENLSVWCYTGFTFEELMGGAAGQAAKDALRFLDVLVDGRFIEAEREEALPYRGSRNQRLIDVPKSLETGVVQQISEEELRECH